jgi:hypothetical protein
LENEQGLWQDIVNLKYVKSSPVCSILNRFDDSPIWKDLMKVRHIYLRGRCCKIMNGKKVSFWLDPWLDDKPLCLSYPILYELCLNQGSSVYEVKRTEWVIQFRTRLQGIIPCF